MTAEQHQTQSVYSSEISIADAINTAATYKEILKNQELIDNQEISNKKLFDRVAEIIKIDIRDCNGITIHPLDPNDISLKSIEDIGPASLRELLLSICGENRKIDSITQDIATLCADGKKRMPKHVGLAISLKNCLRSKEFITIFKQLRTLY